MISCHNRQKRYSSRKDWHIFPAVIEKSEKQAGRNRIFLPFLLKGENGQEKRRENSAQNRKDENRAGKGQRKACLIGEKLKKGRKNEHKPPSKKGKEYYLVFHIIYYLIIP